MGLDGDGSSPAQGVDGSSDVWTPRAQIGGVSRTDIRRPAKTSELVARYLADQIIERDLAPGTRLPPEDKMVETIGVGRSTLREALRLLETRGVLTIKRGKGGGPVVRRPRPEDLSEALSLILQSEGTSLQEVIIARQALEPTLARLAATSITPDEVQALQSTIDVMRERAGDHPTFLEQNWIFHRGVSKAARNLPLQSFVDSLKSIWDGAFVGARYSPRRHRAVADAHQRIVDALRVGDPDAAAATMNQHLDEAARYWTHKYSSLMLQKTRWSR